MNKPGPFVEFFTGPAYSSGLAQTVHVKNHDIIPKIIQRSLPEYPVTHDFASYKFCIQTISVGIGYVPRL